MKTNDPNSFLMTESRCGRSDVGTWILPLSPNPLCNAKQTSRSPTRKPGPIWSHQKEAVGRTSKRPSFPGLSVLSSGSPKGNRTPVNAVRGRRPNR